MVGGQGNGIFTGGDPGAYPRLDVDSGGSPSVTIDLGVEAEGTSQSVTLAGLTLADLSDVTILI